MIKCKTTGISKFKITNIKITKYEFFFIYELIFLIF